MKTLQQLEDVKCHENFLKDIFADDSISDGSKMAKILIRLKNQDSRIDILDYDIECLEYHSNYDGEY
jgi:hypothetical protein